MEKINAQEILQNTQRKLVEERYKKNKQSRMPELNFPGRDWEESKNWREFSGGLLFTA